MQTVQRFAFVPILFVAFVFVQSLFFKFTDSPETQYIFGTLDHWGASLGFPGLFAPGGIFSQYVVGSAELVASVVLLASLVPPLRWLRQFGAALGLAVISGAIFFIACRIRKSNDCTTTRFSMLCLRIPSSTSFANSSGEGEYSG